MTSFGGKAARKSGPLSVKQSFTANRAAKPQSGYFSTKQRTSRKLPLIFSSFIDRQSDDCTRSFIGMPEIKLQFDGKEIVLGDGVTTIGRTTDNAVSFPGDSNVSRYHAEIELRGAEYCLIDLNSSNGTAVNGQKVTGEVYLKKDDEIVLGGTSRMVFGGVNEEPAAETVAVPDVPVAEAVHAAISLPSAAAPQAASGGSSKLLLIAGAICCIAILCVVVAGAVYYFSGSSCAATARISTIEQGETIDKPTDIEVALKDGQCVAQVIYTVDGKPFAASQESPFTAKIDPKSFPDLTDGVDHDLGIILVDIDGNQMPQTGSVRVAFETRAITKPETDPEIVITGPQQPGPTVPTGKEVSLIELNQMTTALAKQFAGGRSYNVSNPAFLQEVKKRTTEYAVAGYFERASKYRDVINVAYAREQNLDAALGYMLAMSRSNFQPKKGTFEGLWQMSPEFIAANGYNGVCGTETLADPSQNCAARASAVYMKALVLGVFEGDMIYSVAVFGKSTTDAGVWKATLPAKRTDVWTSIKTAAEREQLVRFFAAGVVAENPQKFGLKNDLPLSELYKLTR